MRRAPLLFISAAVAAAIALPAQATAATGCAAKAGTTLSKQGGSVRVFTRTAGAVSDAKGQRLRLYACRRGTATMLDQITNKRTSRFTARSAGVSLARYVTVVFDHRSSAGSTVWVCLYDRVKGKEIFNAKLPGVAKNKRIVSTTSGGIAILNGGVLLVLDATGQRTVEAAGATAVKAAGDSVTYTVAGVTKSVALTGHPAWVQGE